MNQSRSTPKLLVLAGFALAVAAGPGAVFGQNAALDAMFKRFDANGNGQLELTEVPSQYRLMIDRAAKQAGMDTTKPLSIDRLKRAASQGNDDQDERGGRDRGGDRGGGDRGGWGGDRGGWGGDRGGGDRGGGDRDRERERERERRRNERTSQETAALVPGFGSDTSDPSAVLVPGFGADSDAIATPLEDRYDERVLRNVDREVLGEYDHNRNGSIDPDEWREVPWGDDPRQDDKNRDGKLSREELAGRIARRWGFGEKRPDQEGGVDPRGGDGRRGSEERDRGERNRDERRRDEDNEDRGRRGGPSGPGGPGGPEDDSAKTRSYAMGLIRQYDKNGDGFLTPDEWKDARTDVRAADRNSDNRVDANELAGHLLHQAQRNRPGGGPQGRAPEQAAGSLRFDTAHERLPKGTPSWFIEKDANADGQVAMAEYSTSWSETTITEFAKYDGNDDGIITPYEAMNPRAAPPPEMAGESSAVASSRDPARSYGNAGRPPRGERDERREGGRGRRGNFGGN